MNVRFSGSCVCSNELLAYTISFWALGLRNRAWDIGSSRAMSCQQIMGALNFAHYLNVPRKKLLEAASSLHKHDPVALLRKYHLADDCIADMVATYLGADSTLTEYALEVTHASVWPLLMSRVKNATVCLYRCESNKCRGQHRDRNPDFFYGMAGLAAVLAHAHMKGATLHVRACACDESERRELETYADVIPSGVARLTLRNLILRHTHFRICPDLVEVTTTHCKVPRGHDFPPAPVKLNAKAFKRGRIVAAATERGE